MNKITPEVLAQWSPCRDGYDLFIKLFPNGGFLDEIINAAGKNNRDDWGKWLFDKCKDIDGYKDQTLNGYRNSGYGNTGYYNIGHCNTGFCNSRDFNTGNYNAGYYNTGNRNIGNYNTGNYNTGNCNVGNYNAGSCNTGDHNSGDHNAGFFNTITPEDILIFNKLCSRQLWNSVSKPKFFLYVELVYWVSENNMTDEEKKNDPYFYVRGGQLRYRSYKEAWALGWTRASDEDKDLLVKLPNFDKDIFKEITGIDIDA